MKAGSYAKGELSDDGAAFGWEPEGSYGSFPLC